jgi:hypothetical protein
MNQNYSNYLGQRRCCDLKTGGSQGPQGAQGSQGAIGPRGVQGATGVNGLKGATGIGFPF